MYFNTVCVLEHISAHYTYIQEKLSTCKLNNYVYMQQNNVNMQLTCIYVNMQLIFVDMQHNDVKCNKYKLHININDACLDEQVAKLFT